MTTDNTPQIRFLIAETRAINTTIGYTTYTSFVNEGIVITEIELNPEASFEMSFAFRQVVLIPVVGSCQVQLNASEGLNLHSEEVFFITNKTSTSRKIRIENPHQEGIKLLTIQSNQFNVDEGLDKDCLQKIPIEGRNQLYSPPQLGFIKIGIFDSRVKGTYTIEANKAIVSFAINGAFEFEERMLNQKDSLYLKGMSNVDYEALTEFAILLIIDGL